MESEIMSSLYLREQAGRSASEKITSLFQPDTRLSARYFDDRRKNRLAEPEKRLMLAVLEDAVRCFQDHHAAQQGKRKGLFDDVQRWFFEANRDSVYGFENICNVLELNPEYFRKGLMRWRTKAPSKHRHGPLWVETKKSPSSECRRRTNDVIFVGRAFESRNRGEMK